MLGHRERPYNYPLFFVKETVFSRFSMQSFRSVEWWTLCAELRVSSPQRCRTFFLLPLSSTFV